MRKDVRMGFAVGGVLLAVIIVAVLVIHRNRNSVKTVAFDMGKTTAVAPSNDATSTDVAPRAPDTATDTAVAPGAAAPSPAGIETPAPKPDAAADKSATRWDALFASTAEDPIKAQLTTGNARPKSHKTHHEAVPLAVANAQIDAGPQPLVDIAPPRRVSLSSDAGTSQTARTHKVAQGETFVSIARAAYGDGRYYKAIETANPTLTPEKLRPGVIVQLPPASQVKHAAKSAKSTSTSASTSSHAVASDGKTYTVQKDDSLYRIAKKLYGKGQKADELYELNKQVIGPDSTRLKIGMVLKLPQAPTAGK